MAKVDLDSRTGEVKAKQSQVQKLQDDVTRLEMELKESKVRKEAVRIRHSQQTHFFGRL